MGLNGQAGGGYTKWYEKNKCSYKWAGENREGVFTRGGEAPGN